MNLLENEFIYFCHATANNNDDDDKHQQIVAHENERKHKIMIRLNNIK
jgi:hypothetical protein